MKTTNLALNMTFTDIRDKDFVLSDSRDESNYWEVDDTVHVEDYELPNNIRIIATVTDGNRVICNYRTGTIEKMIEKDIASGKKNIYYGFAPDNSDNRFPLFDHGKICYDIKFAAIEIEPCDEELW